MRTESILDIISEDEINDFVEIPMYYREGDFDALCEVLRTSYQETYRRWVQLLFLCHCDQYIQKENEMLKTMIGSILFAIANGEQFKEWIFALRQQKQKALH